MGASDQPRRSRARRVLQVVGVLLLALAGLVVVLLVGGWLWLRSNAGNAFIERNVESLVRNALVSGDFEIGRLDTNLWNRLVLTDVVLSEEDGHTVVAAHEVEVRFRLLGLLQKHLEVPVLRASGLEVDVQTDSEGLNSFHRLFGPPDPDAPPSEWSGLPIDLTLGLLELDDGRFRYATPSMEIEVAELRGSATARARGVLIAASQVDFRGRVQSPQPGPVGVRGAVSYDGERAGLDAFVAEAAGILVLANGSVTGLAGDDPNCDLHLTVDPLDLAALDPWLGGPGLGGVYRGTVEVGGSLSALAVTGALDGVETTRGGLALEATAELQDDDLPWAGTVQLRGFHAEDTYPALREMVSALGEELVLDGVLVAAGSGTAWPDGVVVRGAWEGGAQHAFGTDFSSMEGEFSLLEGVLTLPRLTTDGPVGPLEVSGGLDLASGPMDLRVKGRFDARELYRYGAEGFGGRGYLDVHIKGDTQQPEGVYRVGGQVVMRPFTYGEEISFERVDARISVAAGTQRTVVTGDLTAVRGEVYGVSLETVREPSLKVDVPYEGTLVVMGTARAETVRMPAVFDLDVVEGPWEVRLAPTGGQVVAATVDVGAHSLLDTVAGSAGMASIRMEDTELEFGVALFDGGLHTAEVAGTFQLETSAIRLPRLRLEPVRGHWYMAERPATFRLTEQGGIADADIILVGDRGQRLEVLGALGTSGPLDGSVRVDAFDVGLLADLYPDSLAHLTGTADLEADLSGAADAAVVEGRVAATGTWVEGVAEPLAVIGTFAGRDDALELDLSSALDGVPLAAVRGEIPVRLDLAAPALDPDGRVDLELNLRPGPLTRFQPFLQSALPAGHASGQVAVRGTLRDPDLDLAVVADAAVAGWSAPARAEFGARRRGAEVAWWGDLFEGHARRAAVDGGGTTQVREVLAWALDVGPEPDLGDYAVWVDDLRTDLQLLGLPAASLAGMSGYPVDLGGALKGAIRLAGSPNTPVVSTELEWVEARVGDVMLEGGSLALEPHESGYALDLRLLYQQGHVLLYGDVPVYLDLRKDPVAWVVGDLDLHLDSTDLPLGVAAALVEDLEVTAGQVNFEGVIAGSILDPRPDLVMTLEGGRLSYAPSGLRYNDVEGEIRLTRDQVELVAFSLLTEQIRFSRRLFGAATEALRGDRPHLVAEGSIDLVEWSPTEVRGTVVLDGMFATATPDQVIRLSGEVAASGTWPEVEIDGDLRLDDGWVLLDSAAFLQEGPMEFDDRLTIHRPGVAVPTPAETPDEPSLYESFRIQLDAALERNLELVVFFPFLTTYGEIGAALTTAEMTVRVGGDVDVTLEGGELITSGSVEVIDGEVTVFRSKFTLQEGRVDFLGNPYNPILDLNARMDVGSTYVEMRIQGSAEEPEVEFSSPDYSDDSQILTMLLTGQEPQNLSAGQGVAADQALVSLLLSSVFGGSKIRSFSIEADGTVRVGLPTGRFRTELVYSMTQELDENQYAVDFEIPIWRKLVLDGLVGDRESWMDVFWELRF
jgi:autotransporter translocation and assembly factor TamB